MLGSLRECRFPWIVKLWTTKTKPYGTVTVLYPYLQFYSSDPVAAPLGFVHQGDVYDSRMEDAGGNDGNVPFCR